MTAYLERIAVRGSALRRFPVKVNHL
jgi:hypothetical protein